MPCGCTQVLEPDPTGEFTICDNAGSLAYTEHGITPLPIGQSSLIVMFTATKSSVNYSFTELAVENLVDPSPFSIVAEVVNRTQDIFTVDLDGLPDTGNYRLRWNVYITSL